MKLLHIIDLFLFNKFSEDLSLLSHWFHGTLLFYFLDASLFNICRKLLAFYRIIIACYINVDCTSILKLYLIYHLWEKDVQISSALFLSNFNKLLDFLFRSERWIMYGRIVIICIFRVYWRDTKVILVNRFFN